MLSCLSLDVSAGLSPTQYPRVIRIVTRLREAGYPDATISRIVKTMFLSQTDRDFAKTFQVFDTGNKGSLRRDEFERALTLLLGDETSPNQLKALFDEVDADASGAIELPEFMKLFKSINPLDSEMQRREQARNRLKSASGQMWSSLLDGASSALTSVTNVAVAGLSAAKTASANVALATGISTAPSNAEHADQNQELQQLQPDEVEANRSSVNLTVSSPDQAMVAGASFRLEEGLTKSETAQQQHSTQHGDGLGANQDGDDGYVLPRPREIGSRKASLVIPPFRAGQTINGKTIPPPPPTPVGYDKRKMTMASSIGPKPRAHSEVFRVGALFDGKPIPPPPPTPHDQVVNRRQTAFS
eukprot:c26851_g1_i1.p1 GENE.c26851_g1_i1~~c26851_g1_i1.p1  ORF type:complete len:358 (+),score=62.12 c26851_g1_i1:1-1074(+)